MFSEQPAKIAGVLIAHAFCDVGNFIGGFPQHFTGESHPVFNQIVNRGHPDMRVKISDGRIFADIYGRGDIRKADRIHIMRLDVLNHDHDAVV